MKDILNVYKDRLVDISGRNRSFNCSTLSIRKSFDLTRLNFINESLSEEILKYLFSNKELPPLTLLEDIGVMKAIKESEIKNKFFETDDERDKALESLAKIVEELLKYELNLKKLYKDHCFNLKETGKHELFIGYPFIEGVLKDGYFFKAPLFLFPINLKFEYGKVFLEKTSANILLNKVLLLGISKHNEVDIDLSSITTEFESVQESDIEEMLLQLIDYGIVVKSLPQRIEPFTSYKATNRPDYGLGHSELKTHLILGQFPIANAIYNDYQELVNRDIQSGALHKLLDSQNCSDSSSKDLDDSSPNEEHGSLVFSEKDSYCISNLDYSQELAVRKASTCESLVIYGPPGTGKSQTLTNIIADALAKNQRVLMVSQKKAALEVIYNRLGSLQSKSVLIYEATKDKKSFYQSVSNHIFEAQSSFQTVDSKDLDRISESVDSDLLRLESLGEVLHRPTPFGLTLQQMYSKSKDIESTADPRFDEFIRFKQSDLFKDETYLQIKELIDSISEYQLKAFFEFKKLLDENPYLEQVDLSLSSFELVENDYLLKQLKSSSEPFFELLDANKESMILLLNEANPTTLTLSNESLLTVAQKLNSNRNGKLLEPLTLDKWIDYPYWEVSGAIELFNTLKQEASFINLFLNPTDPITKEHTELAIKNIELFLQNYKLFIQKISDNVNSDFLKYLSNLSTSEDSLSQLNISTLVKTFNDLINHELTEVMTSTDWTECSFWMSLGLLDQVTRYSTEIFNFEIENFELNDFQRMYETLLDLKTCYEELFEKTQIYNHLYQTFMDYLNGLKRPLSEDELIHLAISLNQSLNSHLVESISSDNWKSLKVWEDLELIDELSNYETIIPYPKEIVEYDLATDILESYSSSHLEFLTKKTSLGEVFDFVQELFEQYGVNLSQDIVERNLIQYHRESQKLLQMQSGVDAQGGTSSTNFSIELETFIEKTDLQMYFEALKDFKVTYKELQKSFNPKHLAFILKMMDEKSCLLDEIDLDSLLDAYYNFLYQDEINYVETTKPYSPKNLIHFFTVKKELTLKKEYLESERASLRNALEQHLTLLKIFFIELDSLKGYGMLPTTLTRLKTGFIKNENLMPYLDGELILTELLLVLKEQEKLDSSISFTCETLYLTLFNAFILTITNELKALNTVSENHIEAPQFILMDSFDMSILIENELELLKLMIATKALEVEGASSSNDPFLIKGSDIKTYFNLFLEQLNALKLMVKDAYFSRFNLPDSQFLMDSSLNTVVEEEIALYQYLNFTNEKEVYNFKKYKELELRILKEGKASFDLIQEQLLFIETISNYTQFSLKNELVEALFIGDSLQPLLEKEIEFSTLMELGTKAVEDNLTRYKELELSLLNDLVDLSDLMSQAYSLCDQVGENSLTDLKIKIIHCLESGTNALDEIRFELDLLDLLIKGKSQEIKNLNKYKAIERELTVSLEFVIQEVLNFSAQISYLNNETPLLNLEPLTHQVLDNNHVFSQVETLKKFMSLLSCGVRQVCLNKQEYQTLEGLIYSEMEKLYPPLVHQLSLLKKAELLFTHVNLLDLLEDKSVFDAVVNEHVKAYDLFKSNHDIFKTVNDLSGDVLKIFNYSYHEEFSAMKQRIENLLEFAVLREIHKIDKVDEDQKALLVSNDFNSIVNNINRNLSKKQSLSKSFLVNKWNEIFNSNTSFNLKEFTRQANKKRQLWPVRRYLEQFTDLALNLYPCFLLSPEMVSQVLPLTEGLFDLVIFDESSQMFVENAIPSIYRGKKVIVAGDDKQLKPSSTFKATVDLDFEEDDVAELDEESLLDLAKIKYPSVSLNYHYRSKYSELINFSNYAFYNGRLKISPNLNTFTQENPPIERLLVDGHWIDKQNIEEAEAVVSKIYDLLQNRQNNETIGVITFNSNQRDLIEELLDQKAQNDFQFRELYLNEINRVDNDEDVSLFVKNIENVQGDERDIIIFSIGYAPNEHNKVSVNFGPLSASGGENRLNVAISRAKEKIFLVTSIEPERLQVENTLNKGPKLFKKYLQYARAISDGAIDDAQVILNSTLDTPLNSGNELIHDSDFEAEVCAALVKNGYTVESQVGVAGYFIDLAIYDPIQSKYVLGIECDGATYHSSKSARERDVYRQRYLESRGWEIVRIWSRDWWKNPSKEVSKIVQHLKIKLNKK